MGGAAPRPSTRTMVLCTGTRGSLVRCPLRQRRPVSSERSLENQEDVFIDSKKWSFSDCCSGCSKVELHKGFPLLYYTWGGSCRLILKIRPQWSEIQNIGLVLLVLGFFLKYHRSIRTKKRPKATHVSKLENSVTGFIQNPSGGCGVGGSEHGDEATLTMHGAKYQPGHNRAPMLFVNCTNRIICPGLD